ncbi:MAG: hypothetical protein ABJE95_27560 [Byssovorax sp.]
MSMNMLTVVVGFVVAVLAIGGFGVVVLQMRALDALVRRELGGMNTSLRGLYAASELSSRQLPPVEIAKKAIPAPLPRVELRRVDVTRDDDVVHTRDTVLSPPPPGDRESTDELTMVFSDPARPPESGAVLRVPAAGRRSG